MNLEGNWVNSATYGSRSHYPWIHHPPFFSLFPYYDDCFPSVSFVFITTTILQVAFQFSFFFTRENLLLFLVVGNGWKNVCRCRLCCSGATGLLCVRVCVHRGLWKEREMGPPSFLSIFGVSVNPSAQDNKYLPPGGLR